MRQEVAQQTMWAAMLGEWVGPGGRQLPGGAWLRQRLVTHLAGALQRTQSLLGCAEPLIQVQNKPAGYRRASFEHLSWRRPFPRVWFLVLLSS